MLLKRLPKLSPNHSKRFRRRFRATLDQLKGLPKLRGGLSSHLIALSLLILFVFCMNALFTIRTISCSLDNEPCSGEVLGKFNKFVGTNVLLLNQKQISHSLKSSFPVQEVTIGFKLFSTLNVTLKSGNPPIEILAYLVKDLPTVTLDTAPGSSESATWPKPSSEISKFTDVASSSSFSIWDTGLMTPAAGDESNIRFVFSEKPSTETVQSVYRLIKLVNKYLDVLSIQIVGTRVFLSQSNQPDIIVNVPFDEGQVSEAIKSLTYLTSIKKDAKVIDLRFKNPIIR